MTLLTVIFGLYTQFTGFKEINVLGQYLKIYIYIYIKRKKRDVNLKFLPFEPPDSPRSNWLLGLWFTCYIHTNWFQKINELMHSIYSHNFKHTEFSKIYKTSAWQNRSHSVQIRTFIHERHNKKQIEPVTLKNEHTTKQGAATNKNLCT